MDIIYIYITPPIYSVHIYISILYQYLWSRATAGARPPQQFAWPPGHCSWRWSRDTSRRARQRRGVAKTRHGDGVHGDFPWGKSVVLVGSPPFNHEKCVFFFGRKIMGRVERSMTNHIFMQHS